MPIDPSSVSEVAEGLREVGYLPGESTALVSYLAAKLGKPVLVEGPAGVGKTELAKALSRYLDRRLVRLQCYEGLDEAKALYEWNYRKQLLRIQTSSSAQAAGEPGTGWDAVQDDIFSDATTQPVVILTSNNSRELTEALKRRCLYLWLDYPELDLELEIVRLHSPELDETVARKLVEVIHQVRELDLKKPPSIAESIDWARALLLLGARDIDADTFRDTMSIIVKHRTDLDTVAERVGMKLGGLADATRT